MDFIINKQLPIASDYMVRKMKVDFLVNSEKVDDDYINENDANGDPILVKYPCEEPGDYNIRKNISEIRNYVRPIINKYVGSIFRSWPARDQNSPIIEIINGSLKGGIQSFMKEATHQVLIQGKVAIAIGSDENNNLTLKLFENKDILNIETIENKPIACLLNIYFDKSTNLGKARYYDSHEFFDIEYEGPPSNSKILTVQDKQLHEMTDLPVVFFEPFKNSSFSAPISNSQVKIINLLSCVSIEIVDNTFTRWILSGVDDIQQNQEGDEFLIDKTPVVWSTKRLMTFENENVSVNRLGADVGQAASIRDSIKDSEEHLYRAAGVGSTYNIESGGEQSGLSRLVQLEDFSINANNIIQSIEEVENTILDIIHRASNIDFQHTVYSTDVLDQSWNEDINKIRDVREFGMIPDSIIAFLLSQILISNFEIPEELLKDIAE